MTNADKLNNMTNADLFRLLITKDKCDCCSYWGKSCAKGIKCASGVKEWLKSEIDYSGILQPLHDKEYYEERQISCLEHLSDIIEEAMSKND